MDIHDKLINALNGAVIPLQAKGGIDTLIEEIGDASYVLIGEATHGTEEFYQTRIEITKKLIQKKGFMAVAIEGDWPDAYSIHRYVTGLSSDENAVNALNEFKRFPSWMWKNTTIPPFLSWLRQYNQNACNVAKKVGFYGLDLYSLDASMKAVMDYLKKIDPAAAKRAQERYACFAKLGVDPQAYGYLINAGIKKSCVKEAVNQFIEMQHNAKKYLKEDGIIGEEEYFNATQNARIVKDAETYYRTMFDGHISSWNVRDRHMAETVTILADHLERRFHRPPKIVIWAHNSHVGDARATEMGERGEFNIGQLLREQHNSNVFSIGFSTHHGTVAAASDWGASVEFKAIVPGLAGSFEALFHELKNDNFLLFLNNNDAIEPYLRLPRLQRAIGVIYRPETERTSHYFFTRLSYQFDCLIHFDKTTALTPLSKNLSKADHHDDK